MKLPKIGLRVKSLGTIIELRDKIDAFELNDVKEINFNIVKILKAKEILDDLDLSWHSQTSRTFSCIEKGIPEFSPAEIHFLRAEIIVAKILGVKQFIFHLRQSRLDDHEKKILKSVVDFAKSQGIDMLYESNNQFIADTTLDFLESFPDVGYNLDIGHLNTAMHHNTLGMSMNNFLDKVKDRIVFIHAHNNNGERDDHYGLKNGNLDWEKVLDLIDMTHVKKIVMEIMDPDEAKESFEILKKYLKKRDL